MTLHNYETNPFIASIVVREEGESVLYDGTFGIQFSSCGPGSEGQRHIKTYPIDFHYKYLIKEIINK